LIKENNYNSERSSPANKYISILNLTSDSEFEVKEEEKYTTKFKLPENFKPISMKIKKDRGYGRFRRRLDLKYGMKKDSYSPTRKLFDSFMKENKIRGSPKLKKSIAQSPKVMNPVKKIPITMHRIISPKTMILRPIKEPVNNIAVENPQKALKLSSYIPNLSFSTSKYQNNVRRVIKGFINKSNMNDSQESLKEILQPKLNIYE